MPQRELKPMSGWVLASEELHDDLDALRPWVESAHRQAISQPRKPPKKAKKKRPAPVKARAAKSQPRRRR